MPKAKKKKNRYQVLIESVFFKHYKTGLKKVPFERQELITAADKHKVELPKNIGDILYSMQSHLRTTVSGIGQIEIDEVYAGVDKTGRQFVVPVQAKGGSDKLSVVQARQDIVCSAAKFPNLICRAVSAQFMENNLIALFELTLEDGAVKVVDESHYLLVPADEISSKDLKSYAIRKA